MVAYRQASKVTQAEAARRCGIDAQVWARYERGDQEPGLGNATRIQRGTEGAVQAVWFREPGDQQQ